MKKSLLLLTTISLLSANAFAEITEEQLASCKNVKEEAKAIMQLRQMETDVAEVYGIFNYTGPWIKVVDDAYNLFPMMGEEAKEKQATKFGNKYFLICFKAYLM